MTGNPRRDRLLMIYLCFFVSGLAGLIYEILWNKYLALFIGSTGRAHVMTLAVFMGGLALGSAVFGRRADRVRNPLVLYIALEAGVGLCGIAYPFLFEPYRNGFIALARVLGLTASALMTAKLVFCALTILAPTFLMGGTLPVLGRYLVEELKDVGPRVATLYCVNTFGAFVGCLQAGFIMIPVYGLRWSMLIAAGLNFCVCILASLLMQEKYRLIGDHRLEAHAAENHRLEAYATEADPILYPRSMRAVVLATIAVSGFVAMVYEVAWIRLLTLVLGASTYSFSLMVATFIFGIGLGSFLLSFKRRETGYDVVYGLAEVGLGLSVLAMLPLVERVPYWFNHLATLFVRAPFAFGPYMLVQLAICFMLMLAPTVLLGMTLPAASRMATEHVGRVGSRVGTVYALNTIGTLLGAGFGGLLFLPQIGLKHTFEVGIVLNIACGLAVVWLLAGRWARVARIPATALCAGLFVIYLAAVPQWDKNILSSGPYRQKGRFYSFRAMLDMLAERERLLYYKDGVDASIAVVQNKGSRSLFINGKADASDTGDLGTEVLISHYPLLVRPSSKQVLVIGMGSGVSVGSALQYPVEHVDAVEISKEVVEAATQHFAEANFHFADDPRVAIHVEDAKTFLQITPTVYDVIVSEPTNPWIAGVAGLFSKEFFEVCRQHLLPDGMFVQWIHVYEIQDAALMSVLRTFTDAFPYFVIWNMNRYDIALMGSPSPFHPDFAWMEKQMARPEVARDLKRLGIEHPLALMATQMFTNTAQPTDLFRKAVVNSDLRPYLEYRAPVGFFAGSPAEGIKSLDMRAWPPHTRRLWIDDYRPTAPPTSAQFATFYRESGMTGSLYAGKMTHWSARWYEAYPDDPRAVVAWITARSDRPDWQREQLEQAVQRFPKDPTLADLRARVVYGLFQRNGSDSASLIAEAREAIQHAQSLYPTGQWHFLRLLIPVAYREGQMAEVLKVGPGVFPHLAEIRDNESNDAAFDLLRMIGEAAVARGRRDVAEHCLTEMRLLMPNDLQLSRMESAVAAMGGKTE
jgi:predicted membrane-bound spermidine synthase